MFNNTLKEKLNNLIIPDSNTILGKIHPNYIFNNNNLLIEISIPALYLKDEFERIILEELKDTDIKSVEIKQKIITHKVKHGINTIKGVKNIIAIASGKGGVGKSTVTTCLAYAMRLLGANVAVLDADLYGPSQPMMFNVGNKKPEEKNKQFIPVDTKYGIKIMSIGFLVEENQAVIWRGPMVSNALQQLFKLTNWQDIDYMFVDLPPGTGDIQLTLSQKIPVTGSIVVSTPQDIALIDAKKAITMFHKVSIPLLGLIENMAVYTCSNCNHQEYIFGNEGAKELAQKNDLELLAQLPLAMNIRKNMDSGNVDALFSENELVAKEYKNAAWRLAISLACMGKDYSSIFPSFTVRKDKK